MQLADFKSKNPPDSALRIAYYQDEIVDLYLSGYTLKKTYEFLKGIGLGCSYSTLARWVKENLKLEEFRTKGIALVAPLLRHDSIVSAGNAGASNVQQETTVQEPPETSAVEDGKTTVDEVKNASGPPAPTPSAPAPAAVFPTAAEPSEHVRRLEERIRQGFGKSPDEIARDVISGRSR